MCEITDDACQCTNHTGPHWLYEDYRWFERNLEHLKQCAEHIQALSDLSLPPKSVAGYVGWRERQGMKVARRTFNLAERSRWREKMRHMQVSGIISYEVLGSNFQNLDIRKRTLIVRISEMLEKMIEAEESYAERAGDCA